MVLPDAQLGIQVTAVGINIVLLVLIPIGLYFIIKLAIKHGINESKLFIQDKQK